jgi:hypothetical protein
MVSLSYRWSVAERCGRRPAWHEWYPRRPQRLVRRRWGAIVPASSGSDHELGPRNRTPDTIAGWKAVADGLLSSQCCAFHRNVEISSRYAWTYTLQPACFKWAAMAAIASHHVRLALFPLRLDTDRTGYVDIPHSLGRRKLLLTEDVNTIRATNNAIFDDIFWVHLAYVTAADGIERLRALLHAERHYASVLVGFEAIDQGRRVERPTTGPAVSPSRRCAGSSRRSAPPAPTHALAAGRTSPHRRRGRQARTGHSMARQRRVGTSRSGRFRCPMIWASGRW